MDDASRIADRREMLALKRQEFEDFQLGRISLEPRDAQRLHHEILEEEQALRDLGVQGV